MVGAMLADMATQTEAARQLLYTACQEIDAGSPSAARWAAMCQLFADRQRPRRHPTSPARRSHLSRSGRDEA